MKETADAQSQPNNEENGNLAKKKVPNTFRALQHRNFQLFFAGQFISLTGTWMQSVAHSWLVYRLTGSVLSLGLIGFASQIPVFLLAPLGGAFADRHNRQKILVITQSAAMITALVMAILTLTGTIQVWHLFIFATCFGLANAFDIPTRQAFVSDMVAKEDLLNAIALNSSMFNGARIVGPAIAGILVALVGEGWCFFGNAVSYIAVIAGILLMKITPVIRERKGSTFSNIAEGFSFVAKTAPIRGLLLLLGLISLMGMPYAVLMPIFADKILGGGSDTLGYLMGASGLGALAAALILASRTEVFGLGRWVSYASAGLGISLILFSFSTNFWLSLILLIPVGFSMMLQMSSSNTLIQAMVPDELRGRVMSVYSMMFMGMAPLGALWAGTLAGMIGAPLTVALGGGVCLFGALIFRLRMPKYRDEGRQMIIALQMTAGVPASKASFQTPTLTSEVVEKV
ncbi:MAG TPA: MFS transporter [Pyrinomonadaceae bacterium]|nr:MFS transporter [Pyrinomonadaceae bacterium]